ncbi:MAG: hypothetical protein ACD_12C00310G0001 [uncultured bacterium]|nr:MAG: hypothetical protein ACD_12C00310G0001 [uncultured bacterium]
MIQLSDYVIDFLVKKGIKDIFLVSGGGIMYLCDSVGRNKKIKYIANHHEQASSTAAEAWARTKNHISACLVTTGPGGTNAITGVAGAWVDSIPMIVISGQVKREVIADYTKYRQVGPQELNIISMVKPITKYAVTVMDPNRIRYELEKCFYEATIGRPGPVWIDLPLDIQSANIDEKKLASFEPPKRVINKNDLINNVRKVVEMFKMSKKPVLIAGQGVRLSGGQKILEELISKLKIPVIFPINGLDLLPENNKYVLGKFGPVGTRRGNFSLQNSDLIISIGASLNTASTGYDFKGFGRNAKKIMINIDQGEIDNKKIKIDFPIVADAKDFMEELLRQIKNINLIPNKKWFSVCQYFKNKYPLINPDYFKDKKHVNSYVFFNVLSDLLSSNDVLVTGISLDACSMYQAFKVKKGQRAFVNKNLGQMGWCIPAAIGACAANDYKRTILVTGDGSIQFNIHELETIKYYKLPIKIFVFNNQGYESIRSTQDNYFSSNYVGSNIVSGVSNPNWKLLAQAHDFKYEVIKNNDRLADIIKKTLKTKGPILCEVNIAYDQKRMPRVSSFRRPDGTLESRPLEDMFPFLPKEEIEKNMSFFK